jgi:hypothetical protein
MAGMLAVTLSGAGMSRLEDMSLRLSLRRMGLLPPIRTHGFRGLVRTFSRGRFSFTATFLFVRLSSGFAEAIRSGGGAVEVIGRGGTAAAAGCRTMSPLMKIM